MEGDFADQDRTFKAPRPPKKKEVTLVTLVTGIAP